MKLLLPSVAVILIITLSLQSCNRKPTEEVRDSLLIDYKVINTLPHNTSSFIEGLVVYNNKILESTGQEGHSWIAEVNPGTGDHNKKVTLDKAYFGEGITVLNSKIYQLTWTTKKGFIYDARTYKQLGSFDYAHEGWGITHDNKSLIVSDGTDKIRFKDSVSLKDIRTINVTERGNPVKQLNELEFVNGYIYANVWQSNWIMKIDPATGNVVGKVDLSKLTDQAHSLYSQAEVLNGIAYDANSKLFVVTGKHWPNAYLIKLQ